MRRGCVCLELDDVCRTRVCADVVASRDGG